jgi:hypothetical protein
MLSDELPVLRHQPHVAGFEAFRTIFSVSLAHVWLPGNIDFSLRIATPVLSALMVLFKSFESA